MKKYRLCSKHLRQDYSGLRHSDPYNLQTYHNPRGQEYICCHHGMKQIYNRNVLSKASIVSWWMLLTEQLNAKQQIKS